MAKKRTKASKKRAIQRRLEAKPVAVLETKLGKSGRPAKSTKKTILKKSSSKIMQSLDVSQINKDLRKTALVTLVVLAVLLVILNYF